MPSKREVVEDMLAQVEEEFHRVLARDEYPHFFGGSVRIVYTVKPRLTVEIRELGRPGPKKGQRFKKRVGPSKAAMRAMPDTEEF
jgi:hypothetical protein